MTEAAIDQLQSTINSYFVKAWGIPMDGGFIFFYRTRKSQMRISQPSRRFSDQASRPYYFRSRLHPEERS
ncbi:hypothetical protein SynSYN20_01054 [Synechococcus sp. SYN20]|nr:hypothetical protein SynSYN20_01054 [Synechococcus sp. SYN20]